ncbi:MAG: damage-control phosphatase ARMT1 family protein [Pleomorphochaeta sp.]
MKFEPNCINCILDQVAKISKMKNLGDEKFVLLKDVLKTLSTEDYSKTSPEVYGNIWKQIVEYFDGEDIYKDIKAQYNAKFLTYVPEIEKAINKSENPLRMALATAIQGNLLDLAITRNFSLEDLLSAIEKIEHTPFGIDDSKVLLDKIKSSNKILYIGDNCGEIVFDRVFIETIKKYYPNLDIYYVVRGFSAVNDILLEDALQVGMDKFATIIENGDTSLGTVLDRCTDELNTLYNDVDLVIAKGQGNFESLSEKPRENLFYLLLTKCKLIADAFNVDTMSIVCAKARL